jgi:hypothetical protein
MLGRWRFQGGLGIAPPGMNKTRKFERITKRDAPYIFFSTSHRAPQRCGGFYENASFGSHDKPLLVCRGLLTKYEKPTMNS